MKILYVVRTSLHIYPPCLAQILMLRDLGEQVLAIYGDCDSKTESMLNGLGVETHNMGIERAKNPVVGKIQSYVKYNRSVRDILEKRFCEGDIIWYGTADSCFALGKEHKKYAFILNVLELYDNNMMYRRNIGRVIKNAKAVIACEQTRADIMKMWWNLSSRPFVMPNKPYILPDENDNGTTEEIRSIISQIIGKKTFLYQGIIAADRDLGLLARALKKIDRDDLYLALLGKELSGSTNSLKLIYPRTIYLGYVAAPYHLEITRNAFAGVAYYKENSLNNLFCAPNKIYEYSGVGLPILCNNVPGLRNTVGMYNAGECVDFDDINSLTAAILRIVNHHDKYKENSAQMYQATDNFQTMKNILESARSTGVGV